MDYTPSIYYQPTDELDAATPGRVVIDSHEYGYGEDDAPEIDDCAPTLRSTDRAV